jgi:hypothetical protein
VRAHAEALEVQQLLLAAAPQLHLETPFDAFHPLDDDGARRPVTQPAARSAKGEAAVAPPASASAAAQSAPQPAATASAPTAPKASRPSAAASSAAATPGAPPAPAPTHSCVVFVYKLPLGTSEAQLAAHFAQAGGALVGAQVFSSTNASVARAMGTVSFSHPSEAREAVRLLDRSELGGAVIRVLPDLRASGPVAASRSGVPGQVPVAEPALVPQAPAPQAHAPEPVLQAPAPALHAPAPAPQEPAATVSDGATGGLSGLVGGAAQPGAAECASSGVPGQVPVVEPAPVPQAPALQAPAPVLQAPAPHAPAPVPQVPAPALQAPAAAASDGATGGLNEPAAAASMSATVAAHAQRAAAWMRQQRRAWSGGA